MKIVFMGTPDFAAGALEALIGAGHDIILAVTQPDRPKGRSGEPVPPAVKVCALKHGIPVFQPLKIKTPEAVAELRRYEADLFVVAAFGQILSREILDMPRYGSLNIHASLLPKYRGASPIQHVILDGEKYTGVTIMQMDEGIDTGDILYQKEIPIEKKDNYETLHDKLKVLGGEAIVEALPLLEQGKLTPVKQQEDLSCHAPLIQKSMGRIDFTKDAQTIDRQIRGMTPWPGAYTSYRGRQLKIWLAETAEEGSAGPEENSGGKDSAGRSQAVGNAAERRPGEILEIGRDHVTVAAGKGALRILELQLEGKKRMTARDFLPGVRMERGEILGQ